MTRLVSARNQPWPRPTTSQQHCFQQRTGPAIRSSSKKSMASPSATMNCSMLQMRKCQRRAMLRVSRRASLTVPHALAHDSSHTEEEHQSNQRPEPARQFPSHLGSTLSLATKRRFTGSMPKDTEQLRIKDSIMSNMWLRAKLRRLCRSLYSHLTLQTLTEFPNVLLSGKNFRTSERCPFIVPRWDTAYVTSSSCAKSRFD